MEHKLQVTTVGEPSVKDLTQGEAQYFYLTLLTRIIENYRKQRDAAEPPQESSEV